jgi:chromate reductase
MSTPLDIAVLNGSLRRASIGARLATAIAGLAPESLAFSSVPIGEMPLYNQDLEEDVPPAWRAFRERIAACDGILFVTSESNRSIPSPLKNAIDVGSRPFGKSVWNGKPALVVSHSQGLLGGFGANHHLRQALMCLNVAAMPGPEIYLSHSAKLLDDAGAFAAADTRDFLAGAVGAFDRWLERNPAP